MNSAAGFAEVHFQTTGLDRDSSAINQPQGLCKTRNLRTCVVAPESCEVANEQSIGCVDVGLTERE